jgi:acetyl-CoA acetyltransferase
MSFPLDVSIASATRTAVGRGIKGALRDTRPDDLAGVAIAEALRRACLTPCPPRPSTASAPVACRP